MFDQLRLLVRQLSISQRLGIVGGAGLSVAVLVAFVMWAGRPDYQPAFTALTTGDAAAISQSLRTAKIPFEMADAGATILVPASQLADARVAANASGAASAGGGDGFALFDKNTFGMSDFQQQVTYQRAIAGQLKQTIESMAGVESASVSVVPAQQSVFASESQVATASVVIRMRNGGSPDRAMVQGIVSTVAGAVAGLTTDNVTVVDAAGRTLAGPDSAVGSDTLTVQSEVERTLAGKVEAMVDQALGPGHASIAVAASVDMDKVEQTVTTVAPITNQNWTPTSVQVTSENYGTSAGTNGGGIPGALSNIPGLVTYPGQQVPAASAAPAASTSPGASPSPAASARASSAPTASAATSAASGYLKTETTVNYNNSQTIEKIIKQPGAIQKLSVSVLLDQGALGSVTPDGLKTAITAAIGADATRGDVVEVTAVPFAATASAAPAADSSSSLMSTATSVGSSVLGILVALILVFLVWRNMRSLGRRAEEMQLVAMAASGPELLEAYTSRGQAVQIPMPVEDNRPQAKIQEHLRVVAEDKPEELVGLMNTWLRADQKR